MKFSIHKMMMDLNDERGCQSEGVRRQSNVSPKCIFLYHILPGMRLLSRSKVSSSRGGRTQHHDYLASTRSHPHAFFNQRSTSQMASKEKENPVWLRIIEASWKLKISLWKHRSVIKIPSKGGSECRMQVEGLLTAWWMENTATSCDYIFHAIQRVCDYW
jgi:hypothetical protein